MTLDELDFKANLVLMGGLLGLLLLGKFLGHTFSRFLTDVVSLAINAYLCWKHPIKSVDGKSNLKSLPYRWPNGQGDVAKYMEGKDNSEIWNKNYGSVYRIWSGMTPEIVISRSEHVRIVFKDSNLHTKAVNNNSGWLLGELLGKCVGLVSGSRWRTLRAVTEGPFLRGNTASYISNFERRITKHFELLDRQDRVNQGIINPVDDLKLLPFFAVADILYGPLSTEMEAQLELMIPQREFLTREMVMGRFSRFKINRFFPTVTTKALSDFKKEWHMFNRRVYQEGLANGTPSPLQQMHREAECGTVSFEELYQTLDEMLFNNLDVTMGGIAWNLLFLAASTQSQIDLRMEIREQRQRAEKTQNSWDEYMLSSSTFLTASILESARLKPLAAFSVPQAAPTERIVDGFAIPAGTNFVIDAYALNVRNPY